jgi:hypothetical protein
MRSTLPPPGSSYVRPMISDTVAETTLQLQPIIS